MIDINPNKSLPLIIFLFILISSLLVLQSYSLKIHNKQNRLKHFQQPVYDEQRYLIELAQRQNNFKSQIIQIQNDFAGINLMLNDKNINKNDKKIKLNQALADQRDSLIQAQTNLNIPYELKSCQCLNLTEQKKIQLTEQLKKVNTKITQLQTVSKQTDKHCQVGKCPIMKQINTQIQMLKNYQKIMQDTISSKCCKIVKYQYRDNLDTNNWHFGNTTQTQYQAKIYQKQKTSNVKLQPCPYAFPFVKSDTNQCFNCPVEKPLFNLGKRICQKDCVEATGMGNYLLNVNQHVCGVNKTCKQGEYYDDTNKKCVLMGQNYNQSQCPPDRPFWDPLSLSCQSCPSDTPYFDLSIKKCRKCSQKQKWNQNTRTCESSTSQKCNSGYYFNNSTKKCQLIPVVNNDTHSLCPPQRPNWNQFTLSCDTCSNQQPYYDPIIKKCRICTSQQSFNSITRECIPKSSQKTTITCGSDQTYNNITKTCQKRGTTSMCPPSTPYWDSVNFKCVKCPSSNPIYNPNTQICQQCPNNSTYSSTYNVCIPQCPLQQQYNLQTKTCIKQNKACLNQQQIFSYQTNSCIKINCTNEKPFWNKTSQQCQNCPVNYVYNYVTKLCEKDVKVGNVSVCYQDKPVWNAQYLRCEECPVNTTWNAMLKKCVVSTVNSKRHKHHKNNHHQLEIKQDVEKFVQGDVYGNNEVSYQHRWLHKIL